MLYRHPGGQPARQRNFAIKKVYLQQVEALRLSREVYVSSEETSVSHFTVWDTLLAVLPRHINTVFNSLIECALRIRAHESVLWNLLFQVEEQFRQNVTQLRINVTYLGNVRV